MQFVTCNSLGPRGCAELGSKSGPVAISIFINKQNGFGQRKSSNYARTLADQVSVAIEYLHPTSGR